MNDNTNNKNSQAVDSLINKEELDKTHYSFAEFLENHFKNYLRWVTIAKDWRYYADGFWQKMTEEEIIKQSSTILKDKILKFLDEANGKEELERLSKTLIQSQNSDFIRKSLVFLKGTKSIITKPTDWDANNWLLNFTNGTLDLKTSQLQPFNPNDFITKQLNTDFDTKALCPLWEKHINLFIPNDNVKRQVQRDLGGSLTGAVLEESLPIWYGIGANGKSTTANVMMKITGEYSKRAATDLLIVKKNAEHPTIKADLQGARLIFSVETDSGKRLAEGTVKELTGGDKQKARKMRGDYYEFEQTYTIFLVTNHKPKVYGTDIGIWRRLRIVPWTYSIPDSQRRMQEDVINELVEESSGIINWMLAGLKDKLESPGWIADEVKAITDEYKNDQDILGNFIKDCCALGDRNSAPAGELYKVYETWCEQNSEEAVKKRTFGTILKEKGLVSKQIGNARVRSWVGLSINDSQTQMEETETVTKPEQLTEEEKNMGIAEML